MLAAAEADDSTIGAYTIVSLLSGGRTEEARALTWTHVDLKGDPDATPPVLPHMAVWRSVRAGGDTKTKEVPAHPRPRTARHRRGRNTTSCSPPSTAPGWTRPTSGGAFRRIVKAAGLIPKQWTPRELRHSFASVLSDGGMPIEEISRLMGHRGTSVTEQIYRQQIRPVIQEGATAMDRLFPGSAA